VEGNERRTQVRCTGDMLTRGVTGEATFRDAAQALIKLVLAVLFTETVTPTAASEVPHCLRCRITVVLKVSIQRCFVSFNRSRRILLTACIERETSCSNYVEISASSNGNCFI